MWESEPFVPVLFGEICAAEKARAVSVSELLVPQLFTADGSAEAGQQICGAGGVPEMALGSRFRGGRSRRKKRTIAGTLSSTALTRCMIATGGSTTYIAMLWQSPDVPRCRA